MKGGTRIIGVETGDPTAFKSFEEFRRASCRQLKWFTENVQISGNLNEHKIMVSSRQCTSQR